jgi:O-acetyl-ADP-ribose deacetylase (regulator of RNase III)
MPARTIIHAVGPVWGEGDEDHKLAEAYHGSLERAEQLGLASIAFPAISTGIFRFPIERAARIAFQTIKAYFADKPAAHLQLVRMVLRDEESLRIHLEAARQVMEAE